MIINSINKKGDSMTRVYRLDIAPCPKPRMTRADRWKKRKSVVKFFAFRDAVRQYKDSDVVKQSWNLIHGTFYHIPNLEFETFDIEFHVPMPKSWSNKKKTEMNGKPHQQRPDLDNYLKAWKDSVYEEDAIVWKVKATKLWTDGIGHIKLSTL